MFWSLPITLWSQVEWLSCRDGAALGLEKHGLIAGVIGNGGRFGSKTAVLLDETAVKYKPQMGSGWGNVKKLG